MVTIEVIKSATSAKVAAIRQFLSDMDNEFEQPLSCRANLDDYVTKLLKLGQVIIAQKGKKCIGLVAFYANDYSNLIGVYSILVIDHHHRGEGLGTKLFLMALNSMRDSGMKRAQLGTSANNPAIRLYERLGFRTISQSSDNSGFHRVMMEYRFDEC